MHTFNYLILSPIKSIVDTVISQSVYSNVFTVMLISYYISTKSLILAMSFAIKRHIIWEPETKFHHICNALWSTDIQHQGFR